MSLSHTLRELLFGRDETRAFRGAIHDSRNASQAAIGAAKTAKKASEEALRIAQCAIKLLERERDRPDNEK